MIVFDVEVCYRIFRFADGAEALRFARAAVEHFYDKDDERKISVSVNVVNTDDKEEE